MERIMIRQRSYRHSLSETDNLELKDRWLHVNCTGAVNIEHPFVSDNPRGRNDYYLMFMHTGSISLSSRAGKLPMKPGNFYIHSAHTPYNYGKEDQGVMVYLWVHFTGNGVKELLERVGLECDRLYETAAEMQENITERFFRLFDTFILGGAEGEIDAAGCLQCILAELRRGKDSASGEAEVSYRLRRSLRYIAQHYPEPITVEELAKIENLSEGRYNVVFRELFGVTPHEYMIETRLRAAEDILQSTDLNIKEAAALVGYEDQNYFSRLYLKKRGYHARENKSRRSRE